MCHFIFSKNATTKKFFEHVKGINCNIHANHAKKYKYESTVILIIDADAFILVICIVNWCYLKVNPQ